MLCPWIGRQGRSGSSCKVGSCSVAVVVVVSAVAGINCGGRDTAAIVERT